jgi:hypothetical protein
MHDTRKIAVALVGFAILSVLFGCTQKQPHPLIGVWKVTNIVNLDEKTEEDPGNMHYILTERHIMTVGGKEDRPVVDKNFANMTQEEILSQLPAGGGFMEYELKDGKIHRTTKFALSEYFEGNLIITEFEVDATKLIFRDNHHADAQLREWHMERVE